jgi:hypothetical protein
MKKENTMAITKTLGVDDITPEVQALSISEIDNNSFGVTPPNQQFGTCTTNTNKEGVGDLAPVLGHGWPRIIKVGWLYKGLGSLKKWKT